MRVHELAKELGVTSKELLETLEQMGVSGKSASSSVPEDIVPRLRGVRRQGNHRSAEVARGAGAAAPAAACEAQACCGGGQAGRTGTSGHSGARRRRGARPGPAPGAQARG
jgi:translation initiation factor IF-2